MGDTASNVGTYIDRPGLGGIAVRIEVSMHYDLSATARAALKSASGGTDGQVRSALVTSCGSAWGDLWDILPTMDSAMGPAVSSRARLRAALLALPD